MHFNFDEMIDRIRTGSSKWSFPNKHLTPQQVAANPIPMWVADMDFRSPQPVLDALKHAVDHNILGYAEPTASCIDSICNWQKKRFNWAVNPEWLVQTPGVVTAINIAIQAFSEPGDSILIQPPVYVHFHEDVRMNNREVTAAPLTLQDNKYYFDATVFENAIKPNTKIFILCNPHNPTGNVWSRDELCKMAEICNKHNILIISDEIHQDLIFNKEIKHIPFASLSEDIANNCIVCTAPSKTFNVAGLKTSNIFIPNKKIRDKFSHQMAKNGIGSSNCLGLIACEAAYNYGEPWLEAMLDYIKANHEYLVHEIETNIPQLKIIKTDALFLAWIDCRALGMSADELMDFFITKAKIWFDNGIKFSAVENEGHGFMRMNLGCPRSVLSEAVTNLKIAINNLPK